MKQLNKNIKIIDRRKHTKASEEYINVVFHYLEEDWYGWVPIVYRRTGLFLLHDDDIFKYLNIVYKE